MMLNQNRFEELVSIVSNKTRREIIRKLSEGPDYALRIAEELGLGQQLVSKHLDIIHDAGLVDVYMEKSPIGASRKMYSLNKYYSLRIDFAPNLYNQGLISFESQLMDLEEFKELERLRLRLEELSHGVPEEKFEPLGRLVSRIDELLDDLEWKRAGLLYIRNLVMKETSKFMEEMDREERRVLRQIINRGPASVERLSRNLHLREETIRELLEHLEKDDLVREIDEQYKLKGETQEEN
ncbi:MAG: ArsR family transcriptional regulator [Candidatus Bathyarchaeia archaeon]